jgi:hypothetical protein
MLLDGILSVPTSSFATDSLKRFGDDVSGLRLPFGSALNRFGPSVANIFSELREQFREILPPSRPANAAA